MDIPNVKCCPVCGETKPLSEFGSHNDGRKSGKRSRCKACHHDYHLAYKNAHPRNYPPVVDGYKACRQCGVEKPLTSFGTARTCKDGRSAECKQCYALRRKDLPFSGRRRRERLKKFSLSEAQYEQMLSLQGNKCAICGKPETKLSHNKKGQRSLAVDHCHRTGMVRGLLCNSCNLGLGNFRDNPESLQRAIDYLCRQTITID